MLYAIMNPRHTTPTIVGAAILLQLGMPESVGRISISGDHLYLTWITIAPIDDLYITWLTIAPIALPSLSYMDNHSSNR